MDYRWLLPLVVAALGFLGKCAMDDHDRLGRAEAAIYYLSGGVR